MSRPSSPAANDAFGVGTPAYRARHISMLWSAQLWHEAVMVVAAAGAIGLAFYAIVTGLPL